MHTAPDAGESRSKSRVSLLVGPKGLVTDQGLGRMYTALHPTALACTPPSTLVSQQVRVQKQSADAGNAVDFEGSPELWWPACCTACFCKSVETAPDAGIQQE